MVRLLTLSLLFFAVTSCRTEPLPNPSGGGTTTSPGPTAPVACAQLTSEATCEDRDDCHAVFSGDYPCESSTCQNHFKRCDDKGTIACPGGFDCLLCDKTEPTCPDGMSPISDGCCISGCIYADRCVQP